MNDLLVMAYIVLGLIGALGITLFIGTVYALMVNASQLDNESDADRINNDLANELRTMTRKLNDPS